MKTFDYVTKEPRIHARPAGLLVKEAGGYTCSVTITKDVKSVDAKKLFAVMGLGVKAGDTVTLTMNGDDEEEAAARIEELMKATW